VATLSRINPNEASVTDAALYGDPELGPLLRELPGGWDAADPRRVTTATTAERGLCDYFAVETWTASAPCRGSRGPAAAVARSPLYRPHQVGKSPPRRCSPPSREPPAHHGDDPRPAPISKLTRNNRRRAGRLAAGRHDLHRDPCRMRLLAQRLAGAESTTSHAAVARPARCDRGIRSD